MGRVSMTQGKGSQLHNRRAYEKMGYTVPENIDRARTHLNVTYADRDIRQAYEDIFGDALKRYNNKQTRAERRIPDYLNHIRKSKNGERDFYEFVLQWGAMEDFKEHPEYKDVIKGVFDEYMRTWAQRNPNIELLGAYLHMDEASPHLHVDYIPVAHGYKRGLDTRNSLDKALGEMGYKSKSKMENATMAWQADERAYFGELCRKAGLTVDTARKARGSLSVDEYKDAKHCMMGELQAEHDELKADCAEMEKEYKELFNRTTALESRSERLDEEISNKSTQVTVLDALRASEDALKGRVELLEADLSSKAELIRVMDAVGAQVAQKAPQGLFVENCTLKGKKSILGHSESREGAFIEGVSAEEVVQLMNRAKFKESLQEQVKDAADMVSTAQKQVDELAVKKENLANEISVMEKTRDGLDEFFWGEALNDKSVEEDVEIPVKKSVLAELINIADLKRPMSVALKGLIKAVTGLEEVIEKANSRRRR